VIKNRRWQDMPRAEMACAAPEDQPRKPLLGLWLALAVIAAPFVAVGFLWVSYYLVRGLAVLVVIGQAVMS
jgi:hypothetical protein